MAHNQPRHILNIALKLMFALSALMFAACQEPEIRIGLNGQIEDDGEIVTRLGTLNNQSLPKSQYRPGMVVRYKKDGFTCATLRLGSFVSDSMTVVPCRMWSDTHSHDVVSHDSGKVKVSINKTDLYDEMETIRNCPTKLLKWEINPANMCNVRPGNGMIGVIGDGAVSFRVQMLAKDSVELFLKNGRTFNVSFKNPYSADANVENSDSIPMWHFDETNGVWTLEAYAYPNEENYEAELKDFGWWCSFVPDCEFRKVKLQITDFHSNPLPFVNFLVTSTQTGVSNSFTTDENGYCCLYLSQTESYKVEVQNFSMSKYREVYPFQESFLNVRLLVKGLLKLTIDEGSSDSEEKIRLDVNVHDLYKKKRLEYEKSCGTNSNVDYRIKTVLDMRKRDRFTNFSNYPEKRFFLVGYGDECDYWSFGNNGGKAHIDLNYNSETKKVKHYLPFKVMDGDKPLSLLSLKNEYGDNLLVDVKKGYVKSKVLSAKKLTFEIEDEDNAYTFCSYVDIGSRFRKLNSGSNNQNWILVALLSISMIIAIVKIKSKKAKSEKEDTKQNRQTYSSSNTSSDGGNNSGQSRNTYYSESSRYQYESEKKKANDLYIWHKLSALVACVLRLSPSFGPNQERVINQYRESANIPSEFISWVAKFFILIPKHFDLDNILMNLKKLDEKEHSSLMRFLFRLTVTDDGIMDDEWELLEKIMDGLNINPTLRKFLNDRYEPLRTYKSTAEKSQKKEPRQQYVSADYKYFATLGISTDSTSEQVKSAYRILAKVWHPDLPKNADRIEECESKMAEINVAYEEIMKRFG